MARLSFENVILAEDKCNFMEVCVWKNIYACLFLINWLLIQNPILDSYMSNVFLFFYSPGSLSLVKTRSELINKRSIVTKVYTYGALYFKLLESFFKFFRISIDGIVIILPS